VRITKEVYALIEAARQEGYHRGYSSGMEAGYKKRGDDNRTLLLEAQTKLMSAVGQTLQGLASTYDNGPR